MTFRSIKKLARTPPGKKLVKCDSKGVDQKVLADSKGHSGAFDEREVMGVPLVRSIDESVCSPVILDLNGVQPVGRFFDSDVGEELPVADALNCLVTPSPGFVGVSGVNLVDLVHNPLVIGNILLGLGQDLNGCTVSGHRVGQDAHIQCTIFLGSCLDGLVITLVHSELMVLGFHPKRSFHRHQ